ncbi:MAG: hypothetical protein IJ301_02825 [Clostridia bacterium]|nr:hypothetical protein [Clostridia bacterium]
MSIYGSKNIRVKKVIDGKEYESTLGALDHIHVPPYDGEDMKKVKPIKKEEEMTR